MTDMVKVEDVERVVNRQFASTIKALLQEEEASEVFSGIAAGLDVLRQCVLLDIRALPATPPAGEVERFEGLLRVAITTLRAPGSSSTQKQCARYIQGELCKAARATTKDTT